MSDKLANSAVTVSVSIRLVADVDFPTVIPYLFTSLLRHSGALPSGALFNVSQMSDKAEVSV